MDYTLFNILQNIARNFTVVNFVHFYLVNFHVVIHHADYK